MRTLIIILLSAFFCLNSFSQVLQTFDEPVCYEKENISNKRQIRLTWQFLKKNTAFEDKYIADLEAYYWYPVFEEELKRLNGKKVKISGYFEVFEITDDSNIPVLYLRKFASAHTWCGMGDRPELDEALDVDFRNGIIPWKFNKKYITITGTLDLNRDDVFRYHLNLVDAKVVKIINPEKVK